MKRKQPGTGLITESITPKKRRTSAHGSGQVRSSQEIYSSPAGQQTPEATPSRRSQLKKHAAILKDGPVPNGLYNGYVEDEGSASPTPKANGDVETHTPQTSKTYGKHSIVTPSRNKRADRSAKRKSTRAYFGRGEEEDWEDEDSSAEEILEEDDVPVETAAIEETKQGTNGQDGLGQTETPSKKGRGRPKGSKNRRSPTPEGDIPPEERYFFQNRSGPPHVSNNTLASLKLLTHDEYFEQVRQYRDHHEQEKKYLMKLHARSFLQWQFELEEGFNICLYGWGSKRQLVNKFAEWLYPKRNPPTKIVVVNGYTPKLNLRPMLGKFNQ